MTNPNQNIILQEQIAMIVGIPKIDCFVNCVGFKASAHAANEGKGMPAISLNQAIAITSAGESIGILGFVGYRKSGSSKRIIKTRKC